MTATDINTVMSGDMLASIWLKDGKMYCKEAFPIATLAEKQHAKENKDDLFWIGVLARGSVSPAVA